MKLLLPLLLLLQSAPPVAAQIPALQPKPPVKPSPPKETFSEHVLALQGVWRLDGQDWGPAMARLIVHGSYFLLIYQWPDHDARVIEISGFKADGDHIYDAQGDRVMNYIHTGERSLNFEVRDESPTPTSEYTEFGLRRQGRLPNLDLGGGQK